MSLLTKRGEKLKILSPIEWHENMNKTFHNTLRISDEAERIVKESRHLCNVVSSRGHELQCKTTEHLALRAQSVRTLQDQLCQCIKDAIHETDLMCDQRQRLENAYKVLSGIARLNSTCMMHRNHRPSEDLVRDTVDVELHKEQDAIQQSLFLLTKLLETSDHQISANREKKRFLETDWSNKVEHYDVEVANVELTQHPTEGRLRAGCLAPRRNFTNESAWNEISHSHLREARLEIEASENLRCTIDNFLSNMSKDFQQGNDRIQNAFSRHLNELNNHHSNFLACQTQALEKIVRIENVIEDLKRQTVKQNIPMKVAQSRLYNRTIKPPKESFEDSAYHRLKAEVEMQADAMTSVDVQKIKAEKSLNCLLELRRNIDRNIAEKERSIFVDREKCLALRKNFPDSVKLAGF